jgi:hypothetical protein
LKGGYGFFWVVALSFERKKVSMVKTLTILHAWRLGPLKNKQGRGGEGRLRLQGGVWQLGAKTG